MSLATFNHPLLRMQWRKNWTDAWKWDVGTVGIGPWENAGGNKTGSATFLSVDADKDNRESGAAVCPLFRTCYVRIVSRARLTDGTTPAKIYWSGCIAEEQPELRGGQPADTLASGARKSRIARKHWTALGYGGLLAGVDLGRVWRGCSSSDAGIRALESLVRFGYEKRPDDENRSGKRILYARRSAGIHTIWNVLYALLDWHLYEPNGSAEKIKRFPHWPTFEISGLTAALNLPVQDVQLSGTLLNAFAAILHPRRGLFFTAVPPPEDAPSGPISLRVQTFAETAIEITTPEGGTQTVPANDQILVLNAAVPHRSLKWSPTPSPRRLTIHGHRDVRIVSLRWSRTGGTEDGALARKWDSADDDHVGETDVKYMHLYRTWGIRSGWDGTVKGTAASTIPHRLTTAGSASIPDPVTGVVGTPDLVHGAGGLDGGLTTEGTDPFPEFGIEILDQIPMPSLATNVSEEVKPISEWLSASDGVLLDPHSPPLRPMAFVHHRGADTWERINVDISFPDARTVHLGSGAKDAAKIKALLAAADDDLVITCAIRMPSALAVGFIPDVAVDADVRCNADLRQTCNWAERIIVQSGTIFGFGLTGSPTAPTVHRSVRDDLTLLRATLALQRLSGERSAGAVYQDFAELDNSILPGQLITTAVVPGASGTYQKIGYLVTSVRYDPAAGPQAKTTAQIDTAQIDLDTIA